MDETEIVLRNSVEMLQTTIEQIGKDVTKLRMNVDTLNRDQNEIHKYLNEEAGDKIFPEF